MGVGLKTEIIIPSVQESDHGINGSPHTTFLSSYTRNDIWPVFLQNRESGNNLNARSAPLCTNPANSFTSQHRPPKFTFSQSGVIFRFIISISPCSICSLTTGSLTPCHPLYRLLDVFISLSELTERFEDACAGLIGVLRVGFVPFRTVFAPFSLLLVAGLASVVPSPAVALGNVHANVHGVMTCHDTAQ